MRIVIESKEALKYEQIKLVLSSLSKRLVELSTDSVLGIRVARPGASPIDVKVTMEKEQAGEKK